jgi:hypothetical protein
MFLIISCGRGPKRKAQSSDKGQFALDFSLSPGDLAFATIVNRFFPSIEDKELTLEAWVKRETNISNLNGAVFARADTKGAVLYVKDNEPKFAIRYARFATSTLSTLLTSSPPRTPSIKQEQTNALNPLKCEDIDVTSTECGVGSNFSLLNKVWTHIAGVLVDKKHIHPTSSSCSSDVMAQTPHLDFYINGEFADCATSEENFAEDPVLSHLARENPDDFLNRADIGNVGVNIEVDETINILTRYDGLIDEVRFWTIARTQDQIQKCMGQELSFSGSGDCLIDSNTLKGYWRLNEGEGHDITDFSGHGLNGGIEFTPPVTKWDGGWVLSDAPIMKE